MKTFKQFVEGYFSDQQKDYSDPPESDIQKVTINNHFAGTDTVELPVTNRKFVKSKSRLQWEKSKEKTGSSAPGSVEPDEQQKDLVGEVEYKDQKVTVKWNPVYKEWQGRL